MHFNSFNNLFPEKAIENKSKKNKTPLFPSTEARIWILDTINTLIYFQILLILVNIVITFYPYKRMK